LFVCFCINIDLLILINTVSECYLYTLKLILYMIKYRI